MVSERKFEQALIEIRKSQEELAQAMQMVMYKLLHDDSQDEFVNASVFKQKKLKRGHKPASYVG